MISTLYRPKNSEIEVVYIPRKIGGGDEGYYQTHGSVQGWIKSKGWDYNWTQGIGYIVRDKDAFICFFVEEGEYLAYSETTQIFSLTNSQLEREYEKV